MRLSSILASAAAAAVLAGCASKSEGMAGWQENQPDLVIRNARVIDGTGSGARTADVVIEGGRIAWIGDLDDQDVAWSGAEDLEMIDANGRVLAPGFVDTHSHGNPLETPQFENFVAQGVTTISLGMDGSSINAATFAETLAEWDTAQPAVNIAPFVGHGTVRKESGTNFDADPTDEQIAAMAQLVETAMQAGAFGMTTGIEYIPGTLATRGELAATGRAVAAHGGLVMSHIRSEDNDAIEAALEELLTQGRDANVPVHVSHFKVVYGKGADRAEELLEILEDAREDGVTVTADVYPWMASYTGIGIVFPEWALPPNDWAEVKRTRRPELEEYLRKRITLRNGPEATLFGTDPYTGMTLAEVAAELNMDFEDVLIDRVGPFGGGAAYFVMNEELQSRLLQDEHVMVSSDGSPGMHHPRGYASFPKIIRFYVNEAEMLKLPEAIHKMTLLPARTVGLTELDPPRGRIAAGWAADLVLFDPAKVRDTATFDEPHRLAEGMDVVLVNGRRAAGGTGAVLRRSGTAEPGS